MLRIKLVKTGKRNRPTWRVIVVEKTKTGKGRVTEYIGNYNPHLNAKEFKLDTERFSYWVKVGAQPTDAVLRLKGRFIDKDKKYKEIVKAKVYKKKSKGEEASPVAKEKIATPKEEKVEAPVSEEKIEKAEKVEEKAPEKKEKKEEAKEKVDKEDKKKNKE